ncbi:hypothetical protein ABIE21_001083 [Conyzicola nivalis]|uniref:Uncharacterized protein n=1 Tax=Conyzicola nivalis TaxID=1477021 RepID=A0ABV2QM62_9MICO
MDETHRYAEQIVAATAAISRLRGQGVELVKELERKRARFGRGADVVESAQFALIVAECDARLATIERDIEAQRSRERTARTQLAKSNSALDEALEGLEVRAYTVRRPPAGQGVRLTDADFRSAQSSVPQGVFLAALFAVVLMAVVSVANLSLPDWLSILIAVVGFGVATIIGLVQIHYARLNEMRERKKEALQATAEQTAL